MRFKIKYDKNVEKFFSLFKRKEVLATKNNLIVDRLNDNEGWFKPGVHISALAVFSYFILALVGLVTFMACMSLANDSSKKVNAAINSTATNTSSTFYNQEAFLINSITNPLWLFAFFVVIISLFFVLVKSITDYGEI